METTQIVGQIEMSGYAIIEQVIPSDVVSEISDEMVGIQSEHDAESRARLEAARAKGHRSRGQGGGCSEASHQLYTILRSLPG